MRRLFLMVCLLIGIPVMVHAQQYTKLSGWCEDGNVSVVIPGTQGSGAQKFQRSFPSCTITVFNAGTTTNSSIYSTSGGTAKANPFTAASSGQWFFYGAPGTHYDVRLSGGGITSPFTIGDLIAPTSNLQGTCVVTSNGALGNNAHDDTAAIHACFTSLYAAYGGGTVIFPAGVYCVSGVDATTGFSATVQWDIEGSPASALFNSCTGIKDSTKPVLRFGGYQSELHAHGMIFRGDTDPITASAPVIQIDDTCTAAWTCLIDGAIVQYGREGIANYGQVHVVNSRVDGIYGDYISTYSSNLFVDHSQIDTAGLLTGCTATPLSAAAATLGWQATTSQASCKIVEIGAEAVGLTNAVWASTSGGQATFTTATDLSVATAAGSLVYITGVVSTGGSGRGFNGYFRIASINATTIVVTFLASSSPGTYSSGGGAQATGYYLVNTTGSSCTTGSSRPLPPAYTLTVTDGGCSWQLVGPAGVGGNGFHIYQGSNHYIHDNDVTGYFDHNYLIDGNTNNLDFSNNTPGNAIQGGYLLMSGYNITIEDKLINNCVLSTCVGIKITNGVYGDVILTKNVINQVYTGIEYASGNANLLAFGNIVGGTNTGFKADNGTKTFSLGQNTFTSATWGANTHDICIGSGVTDYELDHNKGTVSYSCP